jgi:UDP-N-acetylglucosamine acyltransferase
VNSIHPSAIVADGAVLGQNVEIGPWCHVGPDVVLGDGVCLVSHAVVDGHTRLGEGVTLYPFASVGLPPQDLKYRGEPTRCEIGARTRIREHCTVHRGTATGSGITRVGAECLLMAVVHIAHDCVLGDGVIIANNVVMGGHVTIEDGAVIGGSAALHQFVRIGRGAMVMGNRARLAGLNIVGLRRRGLDSAAIRRLRAAFRLLFQHEGVFAARVGETRMRYGDDPIVAEILTFIEQPSKRGLIRREPRLVEADDAA